MSKTTTDPAEFLASIGLNSGPGKLSAVVTPTAAAKASSDVTLAPEGVEPRTMPVTDIVFDDRLLEPYGDLTGDLLAAASRDVFARYKSVGKNKDRNSLLHKRIGEWIAQVKRERRTGGHVREVVKTTVEQRDLAQVLAAHGITAAELAALIGKKEDA